MTCNKSCKCCEDIETLYATPHEDLVDHIIIKLLDRFNGNRTRVAEHRKMSFVTIIRRLRNMRKRGIGIEYVLDPKNNKKRK